MEKIYKCKCCGKEFQNRDMLLETQEGVFFCQECVAKIAENFQNSETNNVLENEIPDAVKRLIENAEKNGNIKIEKNTTYKFIFGNDPEEIADEEEIPDINDLPIIETDEVLGDTYIDDINYIDDIDDTETAEGEERNNKPRIKRINLLEKLKQESKDKNIEELLGRKIPTPIEIKNILDKYIIGQDRAKRTLASTIYHHQQLCMGKVRGDEGIEMVEKSNVIMLGPTGCGKTALLKRIASEFNIPMVIEDITAFSSTGYVGRDVEMMLRDLINAADGNIDKAMYGIIYIDEIDKCARRAENSNTTADPAHSDLQQALLKIIENSEVEVCLYGNRHHPGAPTVKMPTDNILFIAGGAFDGIEKIVEARINKKKNTLGFGADVKRTAPMSKGELMAKVTTDDLSAYGLFPEFIGRFQSVCTLDSLTEEILMRILTEPENSIVKQYENIFKLSGANLSFSEDALRSIAHKAIEKKTGARGLRGIVEAILSDALFEIPTADNKSVYVTVDNNSDEIRVMIGREPANFIVFNDKNAINNKIVA